MGEVLEAGCRVPSAISTEGNELVSLCYSRQNLKRPKIPILTIVKV